MSDIIMRGNPNLMKTIQESAAKVSKANGINTQTVLPSVPPQGGAAFSIQKSKKVLDSVNIPESSNMSSTLLHRGFDFEKSLKLHLLEAIEVLPSSKEYFNAVQSLITLYALGDLTEGVMRKLSREDLNEIKGIINEFKSLLDSF